MYNETTGEHISMRSRIEISHTATDLARLAWLWAKVTMTLLTIGTLYERKEKLIYLAVSFLVLYIIYKLNEIK